MHFGQLCNEMWNQHDGFGMLRSDRLLWDSSTVGVFFFFFTRRCLAYNDLKLIQKLTITSQRINKRIIRVHMECDVTTYVYLAQQLQRGHKVHIKTDIGTQEKSFFQPNSSSYPKNGRNMKITLQGTITKNHAQIA